MSVHSQNARKNALKCSSQFKEYWLLVKCGMRNSCGHVVLPVDQSPLFCTFHSSFYFRQYTFCSLHFTHSQEYGYVFEYKALLISVGTCVLEVSLLLYSWTSCRYANCGIANSSSLVSSWIGQGMEVVSGYYNYA